MTLLDDNYEFPEHQPRRSYTRVQPAVLLAVENPGRAVLVTELSTVASASARVSGIRKRLAGGVPGAPGTFEVARDDRKVVIRYTPPAAAEDVRFT